MREVKKLKNSNLYLTLRDILTIGNKAVKNVKEENKRYGIPEFFWKNGKIYYLKDNGELTTIKPDILK